MSDLIDPRTGQPMGPSKAQLVQAIQLLDMKIQHLTTQMTQLGLFLEYVQERIAMTTDDNGEPIIDLHMEEFEPWAQARFEQMKQEAQEYLAQRQQQEDGGIRLDE